MKVMGELDDGWKMMGWMGGGWRKVTYLGLLVHAQVGQRQQLGVSWCELDSNAISVLRSVSLCGRGSLRTLLGRHC